MMSNLSFEVSPVADVIKVQRIFFALNAECVFIRWRPDVKFEKFLRACRQLSDMDVNVVPHIVARNLKRTSDLENLLKLITGSTKITQVFLLTGDLPQPKGMFANSFDLLTSGDLSNSGIEKILVAGYPEGHKQFPSDQPDFMLQKKILSIGELGFTAGIVTQLYRSATKCVNWCNEQANRYQVTVQTSVPVGDQMLIHRVLEQIFNDKIPNQVDINKSGPLKYLNEICLSSSMINYKPSLHLITFNEIDTLLDYSNEILELYQQFSV